MSARRLSLTPAPSADAGRSLVRLAAADMLALGLRPGDTVSLTGSRTTHARVLPRRSPSGTGTPPGPGAAGRTGGGGDPLPARPADAGPDGAPAQPQPTGDARCEMDASGEARDAASAAWQAAEARGIGADPAVAANAGARWGMAVEIAPASLPVLDEMRLISDPAPKGANELATALRDVTLTTGDRLTLTLPGAGTLRLRVAELSPGPAGQVGPETRLRLDPPDLPSYPGIAGLGPQVAAVQEMVDLPLSRPDLFERLGLAPPRGILFTGPPGSGKTLLARALAEHGRAAFFHVAGPEIVSKHYGESEKAIRGVFEAAAARAPAIVFIDEIDAIAPRRESLSGEKQVERRVVAQLLTLLDGLSPRDRVVTIAATNLPDALDPALRRPGRFDREIAFPAPGPEDRAEILALHLARAPLAGDTDLTGLAARAHGYVGADLAALAREAGLAALARAREAAGSTEAVAADRLEIAQADLEAGFARTRPSALRADGTDAAPPRWSDVGGLDSAKAALTEAVIWPLTRPDALARLRLAAPRGILLEGPPGTGKTLLARALAAESGMNFIPVRPARLLSKFLGEAERGLEALFRRARLTAPALLFFDELDALAPRRGRGDATMDRIVAQLLTEMDGLEDNTGIAILAATNRAAAIDPALTRPGRFDLVVSVGLPDEAARADVLAVHLRGRPLEADLDIAAIAAQTDGATPADLAALVTLAARRALARGLGTGVGGDPDFAIHQDDLVQAVAAQAARSDRLAADRIADPGVHRNQGAHPSPGHAPQKDPLP
ncbi:MAG: AAA family ATPase [Pseudomonadota bacterium]